MTSEMMLRLREQTLVIINARGAVTNVELAITVAANIYPDEFNTDSYIELLEDMVTHSAIVEAEYVLPTLNYRVKSVFFPAGTRVKVRNG